jgi:plasmid replication initiation protein
VVSSVLSQQLVGMVRRLRSTYAIRLYQWLKRWEFRHVIEVSVADLRVHMGAVGLDEKGKRKENLVLYPDFKRWAIKPAVNEINDHKNSDLRVSFEEIKARGSRAIEKLRFRMVSVAKEPADFTFPEPQPELPLGDVEQSQPDLIDELAARYGLNEKQRQKVANYQAEKGIDYLRQKVTVVDQEPRQNAAKAFLAALRDDWKPKIETVKQPPAPNKKRVQLKPPEPEATDQERVQTSAKLKEFIQTLRASTSPAS